ncbi:hypothetical protein ACFVWY_33830 [Streptomyces sp. NPDC058195]|uniref:hypothetical protein n=1 Tax=Streptomyces sp. NPDC058195 TaxID=3346375 RepID=UPI0036F15B8C
MTTPQPTQRRAQPIAGTRPSVRLDQQLADDLTLLMADGSDLTAAIRDAVHLIADVRRHAADDLDIVTQPADGLLTAVRAASTMYRTAWHHRIVPIGTAPILSSFRFLQTPPGIGPQPLPQVDRNGPMWTPSSSLTSPDDTRQQQPPRPPQHQQTTRPAARP